MKKQFYAMLGLVVCAVFLFGCDAEIPSDEQDKPDTRPSELLLFDGTMYGNVTAVLKVVRNDNGSFKFVLTRENHSAEAYMHLTLPRLAISMKAIQDCRIHGVRSII